VERRHEDQLYSRLDQLFMNGIAFIGWDELRLWYNVDRLSKTPYRDLKRRWHELLESKGETAVDPQVASMNSGMAMLFVRDPKNVVKLSAWCG
jgi:hypothetical protein